MKMVINACYGRFGLSEEAVRELGKEEWDIDREDPALIALIEKWGAERVGDRYSQLQIAEIPDDATDIDMDEDDGLESLTYVVDGKIHHWYG